MKRLLLIILGLVLLTWPRHSMQYLTIDKWSGGLSDGARTGVEGSFRYGKGLDYHTDPDGITALPAMTKDSGATVDGAVQWIVYDPINSPYPVYSYDNNGKIYKKASGSYSALRTVSNSAGEGMAIYGDYLYYTQNSQIGRYGALSGTPSFTDNWQTSLSAGQFKPCKAFANLLLVGHGRYVGTFDGSTWTAQKLTLPSGFYVRAIDVRGEYAVIAANNANSVTRATRGILFYWDGVSSSYNFFTEVTEGGINAIKASQDSVWVFAGNQGNLYLDTGRVTKVKRIPCGTLGKSIYLYPGAVADYGGMLLFGIGDTTTASGVYRGVYTFGQLNKNFPYSLNFAYPISTGRVLPTGDHFLGVNALAVVGNQIYAAYTDEDTDNGIDLLSTTNQQTSVTYESRVLGLTRQASVRRAKIFFKPLRSGESITLKYDDDQGGIWHDFDSAVSYTNDGAVTYKVLNEEFVASDMQFQITLAGTATSMPTVTKLVIEYEEEGMI